MKRFTSITGVHSLTMELDTKNHIAILDEMKIEYSAVVEFAIFLNSVSAELGSSGIRTVVQQVMKDDWNNILSKIPEFELINENTKYNFMNVRCDVKKFPHVMKCIFMPDT